MNTNIEVRITTSIELTTRRTMKPAIAAPSPTPVRRRAAGPGSGYDPAPTERNDRRLQVVTVPGAVTASAAGRCQAGPRCAVTGGPDEAGTGGAAGNRSRPGGGVLGRP